MPTGKKKVRGAEERQNQGLRAGGAIMVLRRRYTGAVFCEDCVGNFVLGSIASIHDSWRADELYKPFSLLQIKLGCFLLIPVCFYSVRFCKGSAFIFESLRKRKF